MQYRITFLGTGTSTGVPLIGCQCPICTSEDERDKRLRSSVLVEAFPKSALKNHTGSGIAGSDGTGLVTNSEGTQPLTILIDAGPDFRQQMLRVKVKALDGILLTHEHWDHVAGLDDVRALNFLTRRPVPVYGEQRVLDNIQKVFSYAFVNQYLPGLPKITLHTIENREFSLGDVSVIPVRAYHNKLPVYGFRIGPFGYLTDANYIDNCELDKFTGVEVFVVSTVMKTPHRSHFALEDAIQVGRRTGARQIYLTHMSHRLGPYETFCEELPPGVAPAYDGLVVEL